MSPNQSQHSSIPFTERQYLLLTLPGQGEIIAGGPYGMGEEDAIDMELDMIHFLSTNMWEEELAFRYLAISADGEPELGEFDEKYISSLKDLVWLEDGDAE